MSDTPHEISTMLIERYQGRSPGERLRMVTGMFRAASALARAGIRAQDPGADEPTIRARLLRRLHGGDLTEHELLLFSRSWESSEHT
mgnify:CR=1 FL=1|jgi:hypothetical protein